MLQLLQIISILLILAIVSYTSFKLGKRETRQSPIYLENLKDMEVAFYEEKYIIYKACRGWVLGMEDTKNAIACHSRMEELNRGENLELEFEWDFETQQYILKREEKSIDSTDDFY